MSYMFYFCNNLEELNLSSFDTKNVTNIDNIFFGCPKNMINSNLFRFKQFNIKDLVTKNNQINILIKINKEDINKEIYFLDNGYYFCGEEYYNHNNLKELNDLNTELYINDKKYN